MKLLLSSLILSLTMSAFADSASIKIILDQPEIEKLEQELNTKGFSLFEIVDVYAKQGMIPRCPCENVDIKFAKVNGTSTTVKTYNVTTSGFGTNLKVKIEEAK